MHIRFDQQRVIVTGAARGFGLRIATRFVDLGAEVYGCDIAADELDSLRASGAAASVLDLRDRAAAAAFVQEVASAGPVDILVNCCGGPAGATKQPIETVPDAQWDDILDINAGATFAMCRAIAPVMKASRSGRIVNISSGAGLRASPTGIIAYTAAKHAIVGLTRQLAAELGPFGVTVNSVAPGFVRTTAETEAHWQSFGAEGQAAALAGLALRRLGSADDIADATLFFASDHAGWITGQILAVDGGR